jgi:hypothetical protein
MVPVDLGDEEDGLMSFRSSTHMEMECGKKEIKDIEGYEHLMTRIMTY